MKNIAKCIMLMVFAMGCESIFSQELYLGEIQPEGFQLPAFNPGSSALFPPCLTCASPEGEPDIPNGGLDNFNGGCNSSPNVFSNISIGDIVCGRCNGYAYGASMRRDLDWYQLVLTQPTTIYWTGYHNFNAKGMIVVTTGGYCPATILGGYYFDPGVAVPVTMTLNPGTYYLLITMYAFGPGYYGNYMVKLSKEDPGDPANWCVEIPTLSEWGLIILGLSLLGFGTFFILRMKS